MKKLNKKILQGYLKATGGLKVDFKSQRGGIGIIVGIIFGAIIILAVLGLDADVRTLAASIWSKFSTWLDARLDTLFS